MAGRHYHHGNSPAAWTAVLIIFVGFSIGSAYTVMAEPLGVLAGAVVVALGGVVGLVMRAMGLGQAPAPARPTTTAAGSGAAAATVPAPATGEQEQAAVSS
ncbi:HGxxPAAW family protein [Streptomyces sp. MP131-18]|uniref:HGxxPAAW family protein n=1 Tax=Streptomyces sp. MP131-18 TaxID=1857892 RepID=UPI00097C318A|nr:HGxxPAAW family protein [Streptomyces sp. MP131-18]ONK15086.1 hypothetical protein STBA_58990 [Streptomyces sp. MP131-18]